MPTFPVPGAHLTYTSYSPTTTTLSPQTSPSILLLIPGAPGTLSVFNALAPALAMRDLAVTTYSRRGYSGSPEDPSSGARIYEGDARVERDADDAAALLSHLISTLEVQEQSYSTSSAPPKAYVLGTSSGGIVALDLLQRYPALATRVLIHEPPLVSVLPSPQAREAVPGQFEALYQTSQVHGARVAVERFVGLFTDQWEREEGMLEVIGLGTGRFPQRGADIAAAPMVGDLQAGEARESDVVRWLEHELRQYPCTGTITAATLSALPVSTRSKAILLAGELSYGPPSDGEASKPLTLGAMAVEGIAGAWTVSVEKVSGGHIGYADPKWVGDFARVIAESLNMDI